MKPLCSPETGFQLKYIEVAHSNLETGLGRCTVPVLAGMVLLSTGSVLMGGAVNIKCFLLLQPHVLLAGGRSLSPNWCALLTMMVLTLGISRRFPRYWCIPAHRIFIHEVQDRIFQCITFHFGRGRMRC